MPLDPMSFIVLAVGPWYPATAFTFFVEAFARVGCRVIRVGPCYFTHMGLDWGRDDRPTVDLQFTRDRPEWNLPEVVDWCTTYAGAPDLLFCSEENYQTDIINETRIPSVLWSADSWPQNYQRADLWRCTLSYCNQPRGNRMHPREDTPSPWRFLPGAAHYPFVHRPLGLARDMDFCLLSTMYTRRPIILEQLRARGFSMITGQQGTQEYVRSYNRALTTMHQPGYYEVKFRWWEAIACGCVNITNYTPLFDWLGYKPYEHYIPVEAEETDDGPWPIADKVAEKIIGLKKDKELWQYISTTAFKKMISQDTYIHRCQAIFRDLGWQNQVATTEDFLRDLTGFVNISSSVQL